MAKIHLHPQSDYRTGFLSCVDDSNYVYVSTNSLLADQSLDFFPYLQRPLVLPYRNHMDRLSYLYGICLGCC